MVARNVWLAASLAISIVVSGCRGKSTSTDAGGGPKTNAGSASGSGSTASSVTPSQTQNGPATAPNRFQSPDATVDVLVPRGANEGVRDISIDVQRAQPALAGIEAAAAYEIKVTAPDRAVSTADLAAPVLVTIDVPSSVTAPEESSVVIVPKGSATGFALPFGAFTVVDGADGKKRIAFLLSETDSIVSIVNAGPKALPPEYPVRAVPPDPIEATATTTDDGVRVAWSGLDGSEFVVVPITPGASAPFCIASDATAPIVTSAHSVVVAAGTTAVRVCAREQGGQLSAGVIVTTDSETHGNTPAPPPVQPEPASDPTPGPGALPNPDPDTTPGPSPGPSPGPAPDPQSGPPPEPAPAPAPSVPHVLAVGSNVVDGIHGLGESVDVRITFTASVTVSGTPRLALETGAADGFATYASGSGTSQLVFAYVPAAGHASLDLDYQSGGALSPNGGSIRGQNALDADLTLPAPGSSGSLGATKNIAIDTDAPAPPTTFLLTALDQGVDGEWLPAAGAAGYLMIRRAGQPVSWVPTAGVSYAVGAVAGSPTHRIASVGADAFGSDTSLANGTLYHYSLYAYDAAHNYSPVVVSSTRPKPLATRAVKGLAGGYNFNCALFHDGAVKCWGANAYGQLGRGHVLNIGDQAGEMGTSLTPINLGTGKRAIQVATGLAFACALLDDGSVKCWGQNSLGNLGLGDAVDRGPMAAQMGDALPALDFGTNRRAVKLALGDVHACVLLDDRRVKCWGQNGSGQLGIEAADHRGDASGEMGNALPAVNLGTGRTALDISAGELFTCALLDNGRSKCWGHSGSGRIGFASGGTVYGDGVGEMGDALPFLNFGTGRTVMAQSVGRANGCAILDLGTVKCWGYSGGEGHIGQPGVGGDIFGAGLGDSLLPIDLGPGRRALATSVYWVATCFLTADRVLRCLGAAPSNGLGINGNATVVGTNFAALDFGNRRALRMSTGGGDSQSPCALLADGAVKCWGTNDQGALGLGDTLARGGLAQDSGANVPDVNLAAGLGIVDLAAGGARTCIRLSDGRTKCFGSNEAGELGIGDLAARGDDVEEMGNRLPTLSFGTNRFATAISLTRHHSCVILDDSSVKCWGDNDHGQLGQGDTIARGAAPADMGDGLSAVSLGSGRIARSLALGVSHTCALLDDYSVKCWGKNDRGQLGLGDKAARGDAGGELGDALPVVDLGLDKRVRKITAGLEHSCAILQDSTVKCWGDNFYGQLGAGDLVTRGDHPGEMGDSLTAVALGTNRIALEIAAGDRHTCALLDDGSVKCWGENSRGQLGLGDTEDRDQAAELGDSLATVALGTNDKATMVVAAGDTTCALLASGDVVCWGANLDGVLGTGDTADRGDGPGEMGDALAHIPLAGRAVSLALGDGHACAMLSDGNVRCWGRNTSGELGLGDALSRGDQADELGAQLLPISAW